MKKQAKDWKIYPANSSQIPGKIAKIIPAKISLGSFMNFSKIIPRSISQFRSEIFGEVFENSPKTSIMN